MFRRNPSTTPPNSGDDPLISAELPARVEAAHQRLAHQHDPALTAALSERELSADRAVAERIRDHARREEIARVEAAEATAAQVRRATDEIVRADAQDLVLARRALAEQRREASPHAQLAHLYRVKKWSGHALAGVVVAAMLWSAVNVQHNVAPGGPSDPLYWASYLLEALISTVLVVFMVSGSAVARWKVTEGAELIRWTEVVLLAATITLNTYPYLSKQAWFDVAVHSVAPVMIGVALVGHDAVSRRMGVAIARASAQVPADDDITERLDALSRVAQPAAAAPVVDETDTDQDAVIADLEREFEPAPQPAPHFAAAESADGQHPESAGGAHESAGSLDAPSTSATVMREPAPHYESAESAGLPHSESAGALPDAPAPARPAAEQAIDVSADRAPVTEGTPPAPAGAVETSTDAAAAPDAAAEVPTPRTSRPRPHQTTRTSPAPSIAPASAGSRSRSALALSPVESADRSAQVRGELTELAAQVRGRRVGQRLPAEVVVRVLEMLTGGASINAVHEDTGVHRKTVERIRDTAAIVRAESDSTGGGGRVIELRKHTDRT